MDKIIGNTTATPNPQANWAQTDSRRADYIKNKPNILTEDEIKQLIEKDLPETTVVLYTDQTLTDEQKTQARENIDALGESELQGAINSALAQAKESGEFDGTSVTVLNVSESTASGGSNAVTFSDGKTLSVRNGIDGKDGKDGETNLTQFGNVQIEENVSKNLYDSNNEPSVGIIYSDGVFYTSGWEAFLTTDYLKVEPNRYIVLTAENAEKTVRDFAYVQNMVFYDANKNLISSNFDVGNKVLTTPSDCHYVRVSAPSVYFERNIMLEYASKVMDTLSGDELSVGIIYADGFFYTEGWEGFRTTDYVMAAPITDIVVTSEATGNRDLAYVTSIAFYDIYKNLISVEFDVGSKVFTTPNNCYYVRLSAAQVYCESNMVLEYLNFATDVSHYEPYYAPYANIHTTDLHGIGSGGDVEGLPTLYLSGDTSPMSKDDYVTLGYAFQGKRGTCEVKWQGSSSLTYPEKNYTIKFDAAFEAVSGWGAEKKYCAKANYIDFTQARNVCAAKLWGQIVKSRSGTDFITTKLNTLPNGGAIDGFPIIIILNDEFLGVYTFNIPKEGWMFGMGAGTAEYILCAENWGDPERFKATIANADDIENSFSIEYTPDGTDATTIVSSLNNLIQATMNAVADPNRIGNIDGLIDWDSAIDYYIFTCLIGGLDITAKNYLLVTYDGTKWFFSAYDLDSIFGLYYDGSQLLPANTGTTFAEYADTHNLMYLIRHHKTNELKTRYENLRNSVLSEDNVVTTFSNFIGQIPANVYEADRKRWHTKTLTAVNNMSQIADWYRRRVAIMDGEIEKLQ